MTPYEAALLALLGKGALKIIVIGANDGKWNDPLYDFVQEHPTQTKLLFSEPQPELVEILAANYKDHPDVTIFSGAVSATKDSVKLYRVRPEIWETVKSSYLLDAPLYRAPSGFASGDLAHVVAHTKKLRDRVSGDSVEPLLAIEELVVEGLTLEQLVSRFPSILPVDVLQVDVEGFDDEIVLASISPEFLPKIIYFEISHLTEERYLHVADYLSGLGYENFLQSGDLLAIHTKPQKVATAKKI